MCHLMVLLAKVSDSNVFGTHTPQWHAYVHNIFHRTTINVQVSNCFAPIMAESEHLTNVEVNNSEVLWGEDIESGLTASSGEEDEIWGGEEKNI